MSKASDVITTMSSYVTLEYNGVSNPAAITEHLEDFTYTDFASGSADTISVTLFNKNGVWLRKDFFPGKNDWLKATITTEHWPIKPANGKIKCGKFQIDHVQYSGYGERATIEGIAVPQKAAFSFTQRNKTWKKMQFQAIIDVIAKRAGLGVTYGKGTSNPTIEEISQSGTTDLEFIFSLCSQYDMALKVYNSKLVIYDQTTYEKKAPVFAINRKELQGSYTIDADINSKFDSVKMQYTNGKDSKTLTYSFKRPGTNGSRTLFISSEADSQADAEKKAKAQLRQSLRESTKISISEMMGGSRYVAGSVFKLEGFGKLNGNYFIDQVTHTKGASKYTCSMEAHKVVTDF